MVHLRYKVAKALCSRTDIETQLGRTVSDEGWLYILTEKGHDEEIWHLHQQMRERAGSYLSLVCGSLGNMMNGFVTPGAALNRFMYVLTVMGKASVATGFRVRHRATRRIRSALAESRISCTEDVLQLQAKPPRRAPHGHDSKRRR